MHVSNMKFHTQVMHRRACIDCGQVGGLRKSPGTPRQPGDFSSHCTVSGPSVGHETRASGRTQTDRPEAGPTRLRHRLFGWRTWLLPDEKTRRPTRLSGHWRPSNPELLGPEWSPMRHMPITGHGVDGAAGRNRTCDPLLRREMLYPLSYSREARQCIKG